MKIIDNNTPTSDITAVKIGDEISNGLGTFGQVTEIKFEDDVRYWRFTFELVGGGIIEVKINRNIC